MPLECIMFCLDTSSYMRNGDLNPTRLKSQELAISSLVRYKLEDNIESSVGLLTMAGYKVDVQISPSRDVHKMINALKVVEAQGANDILSSLKISQLTLRNRSNKHQRQRVVMFIGSPINVSNEQLVTAGKELKKNNIALDIVLFGYETLENQNYDKSKLLIDTVQNGGNSHLIVHYDPALFDITTLPEEVQAAIPLNTTSFSLAELAMRSAVGRNVQPRVAPAPAPAAPAAPAVTNVSQTNLGPAANHGVGVSMEDDELDDDLLAAIELSKIEFEAAQPQTQSQQSAQNNAQNVQTSTTPAVNNADMGDDDNDDEMDPDLLAAIQLSLMEEENATTKKDDDDGADDFNALLEAVSGGAVTKQDDEKEKKE